MKGLSPLVSVVILIVISISIASMMAPWMYELTFTLSNQTGSNAQQQMKCRSAGLDFDSNYGYYGVVSNFSYNVSNNETDLIRVKIVNTGNIDLYSFTFEVAVENASVENIYHYMLTDSTDIDASDPLRPGMSAFIEANVTEDFNASTASLNDLKIISSVCPEVAPSIEL